MEAIKEALLSRNIFAWAIAILVLILFLKFLKTAGKGFLLFLTLILLVSMLSIFFPQVLEPLVDFVRGGWLGDNRPDRPW
jgi:hypothetical protein